jgi:TonB-dependent starch-binding outer membrane protein SusC
MCTPWNVKHAAIAMACTVVLCAACASGGASKPEVARAAGADTVRVGNLSTSRRQLTDAVGSITSEDLETMRVSRVEELIRGRMAGVEMERDASGELTIRIRGGNNLGRGTGEPLLVLDGMPMNGRRISQMLAAIMPGDVARIDVLKDAGATAPYGIRGANGVILITTRKRFSAAP